MPNLPSRTAMSRRAIGNFDLLRSIGVEYAWNYYVARRAQNVNAHDSRNAVYRAIWEEAAEGLGAEITDIGSGILEIASPVFRTRVWQQHIMLDDMITLRAALDKPLTSRRLAAAGLPVPASLEYDENSFHHAVEFLEETDLPCVIKPARGTGGGAATVCGVTSVRDLARATVWASRAGPNLLIERQAPGQVYRFLLLRGELLGVIRTGPATVTGDGRSTIYQLIAAENRRRFEANGHLGLTILSVDRDCLVTLERAGRTLRTIPIAHETITIKTISNDSCVEDNVTVRKGVSPALIEDVACAAETTGLMLAGVDIITSDLTLDLRAADGVVIEVNGGPALHRHYHVRRPDQAQRVAIPILERLSRHQSMSWSPTLEISHERRSRW